MTAHQEMVPVSQPNEAAEARDFCDELLEDLQQERDELRVQLNLAEKEFQKDLDYLDERFEDLIARTKAATAEADEALEDIEAAGEKLWTEIKNGVERVYRTFTE
jgi:archaellum component FlaC